MTSITHQLDSLKTTISAITLVLIAAVALLVSVAPQPAAAAPMQASPSEGGVHAAAKRCTKRRGKATTRRGKRTRRAACRKRRKAPALPQQAPPAAERPQSPSAPQASEPAAAGTQQAAAQDLFEHDVVNARSLTTVGGDGICSTGGFDALCAQPTYTTVCTSVWVPMSYYRYPWLGRYFNWFDCRGNYLGYSDLDWSYRADLGGWYGWEWGPYVTR